MRFWIEDIRSRLGVTVLMVEHDMGLVSAVSDRVLALADGRVLALGHARRGAVASAGRGSVLGTGRRRTAGRERTA